MEKPFTAEFFRDNRKRLVELLDKPVPIILTANGLLQRNNDSSYPYRQDSTFWYLTGINDPDIVFVIDEGKEYLLVPELSSSRQAFDGAINAETLQRTSGIQTVKNADEGWSKLARRLKQVKQIASITVPPAYIPGHGLYTNPARQHLRDKLMSVNSDLELLDLRPQIVKMRAVKQRAEIAAIQKAIDITLQSLHFMESFDATKLAYEYQIESVITANFRDKNCQHAYQPIVAAGKNACTLHYIKNDTRVHDTDLVLIDAGAEYQNYAADITRTFSASQPNKRQQTVLAAVLDVQDYAKTILKPGVLLRQYEKQVENFMGEKLQELGLIKDITTEEVRKYYPHATSHFLGLDVHDIGDYEQPLEAGMVLTIEPGIYIPEEGIGVRIEDDALITATGLQILSDTLPATSV